ncbi:MAG: DUF58 domain-containing protein [Gammaproteobacteria bacterium]|nr:DUF58 domain-containing protein [Gammaproteobacteria bacterium]
MKSESLGQRFFRTRADDVLPLTMTHERIYILPSARGWMFVASLFVMLIASINYSLSLGYALCFLLTGLFSSALLATYRNLAGITVSNIEATDVTAGKPLIWQIELKACSALSSSTRKAMQARSGIMLRTDDITTNINLQAKETSTIFHRVPTRSRGWLPLGRITLSSDYPLGLWRTWCYLHVSEHALVLPCPEENGPPLPTAGSSGNNHSDYPQHHETNASPAGEFAGLRAYRSGDAINNIAWKAAARGQGLQCMEFSESMSAAPLSLEWLATAPAGDTEARLSRLAHWVNLANSSGSSWCLSLPEKKLPLDTGAAHVRASHTALALYGQPEHPAKAGAQSK